MPTIASPRPRDTFATSAGSSAKVVASTIARARRDALRDEFKQIFGRKELSDEQRLNIFKNNAGRRIEELERRLKEKDFEPKSKRPPVPLDREGQQMKSQINRLKDDFAIEREKAREAADPRWKRVLRSTAGAARASALSGYHTLAKLASFSLGKMVEIPVTESVGALIRRIPGVEQIAKKATMESAGEFSGLAKFYSEMAKQGFKDAWQTLTTGKSDLKAELGDPRHNQRPVHWYDYFGLSHMVEKSPLLRGDFELHLEKGMQWAEANGMDLRDDLVRGAIRKEAFDYAQRAILQENNAFSDWINSGIRSLEKSNPKLETADVEKFVMASLIKTFVTKGILKTPANYVKQSFERTPAGLVLGTGRAVAAHIRGIDKLSAAEANSIVRLLKVGAVGSAMFVWGAVDATKDPKDRVFGGYFQPGDKRGDADVMWGRIRIGNWEAPHILTHNPILESAQMGSTFMRVTLSKLHKKDKEDRGALAGTLAATLALASEAPIANPMTRDARAIEQGKPQEIFWDAVTGLIPQLVQNVAQDLDQKSRQPRNLKEAVEATIPFARENVPETKAQKRRDIKERIKR